MRRTIRTAAAAIALMAMTPAAAQAANVTVTGDTGQPVAINPAAPPTIRNMDVTAVVTPATSEPRYYKTVVIGPDGAPASTSSDFCWDRTITASRNNYVTYRGNGVYRVVVNFYGDRDCTGTPRGVSYPYAVNARVAVAQPQSWLLMRRPNDFAAVQHNFAFAMNPGTSIYEVRYARGGVVAADGSISGASEQGFVDTSTGTLPMRFDAPGDWVIVARAQKGQYYTPWSPAVRVRVKAPFDIQSVIFPDSRGPRYSLRGTVREKAAAGKRVRVSIARGRKGGKFRRLGRAKVRANGSFRLRFRVRRPGVYRLRFTYKSTNLIAGGRVTQRIRVRRRLL